MADTQTITPDAVPTGSLNSILKTLGQDYAAKSQQASDASTQLATEKATIQKKLDTAESQVENLKPPAMVPLPPPPQPKATSFWEELGSPAMILAALGSLMTQTPLTTALNAGAGVMKAYKEGDQEAAQHQMEVWKAATDNALRLQDYQDKIYNASIKKLDTETSTALAELTANASAFRDNTMQQMAASRDLEGIANLQMERERLAADLRNRLPDASVWQDMHDAAVKANGGKPLPPQKEMDLYAQFKQAQLGPKLDKWVVAEDPGRKDANGNPVKYRYNVNKPDETTTLDGKQPYTPTDYGKISAASVPAEPLTEGQRQARAAQTATGQPVNQIVPGYGRSVATAREQAREDAIDLIMKQNPKMSYGDAGKELALRSIEYQSGKQSVGQLTKMLGATRQAVSQLDYNIDMAKKEMAKLPSSNISPVINAIVRGEEKWSGDPAYSGLFFYLNGVAAESARIMSSAQASAAQLHEGARQEAQQWAGMNLTPASFDEVGAAMKAEGNKRIENYADAIDAMEGRQSRPHSEAPDNIPPGAPTATDAKGNKVYWDGTEWKSVNGR